MSREGSHPSKRCPGYRGSWTVIPLQVKRSSALRIVFLCEHHKIMKFAPQSTLVFHPSAFGEITRRSLVQMARTSDANATSSNAQGSAQVYSMSVSAFDIPNTSGSITYALQARSSAGTSCTYGSSGFVAISAREIQI